METFEASYKEHITIKYAYFKDRKHFMFKSVYSVESALNTGQLMVNKRAVTFFMLVSIL